MKGIHKAALHLLQLGMIQGRMISGGTWGLVQAMISEVFDTDGVAVITGGASGFGLIMAERLVKSGMRVAILDVSAGELARADAALQAVAPAHTVLAVQCNVTKFEQCQAAQQAVLKGFPGSRVSFLFNNAGIAGSSGSRILVGDAADWQPIFSVNVFGVVNILKAFVPFMIEAGPLPSGKKAYVVTTSSVVGLLNHNIGPYSASKMAVTAVCEQFSHELEDMGATAGHISPHSLHPTVAATNFLTVRDDQGKQQGNGAVRDAMLSTGGTTADQIIDGLLDGLGRGLHYVIVDHPADVPTTQQIAARAEDQVSGRRPRKPEQLGSLLKLGDPGAFEKRLASLGSANTTTRSRSNPSFIDAPRDAE